MRFCEIEYDEIPKIIWTFWDTKEQPEIVQNTIETWRKFSPDFKIVVLNFENLNEYLPGIDFKKFRHTNFIQRTSDFIRVYVLAKYGGIWSDASIVATQSHNWIIDEHKKRGFDFFAFSGKRNQELNDYPVIENYFFACKPQSNFIVKWRDEFTRITNYEKIEDYVQHIKSIGVNVQKIPNPDYLTQDVSAQVVMQKYMTPSDIKRQIYTLHSEDGPYKHSHDNSWIPEKSVKSLCDGEYPSLIKLYGNERRAIEKDPELKCSYRMFSNKT